MKIIVKGGKSRQTFKNRSIHGHSLLSILKCLSDNHLFVPCVTNHLHSFTE